MALGQRLIPQGVDFDTSPVYIKSDKAYFLKGVDTGWTINGGQGQNAVVLKPSESNALYCSVPLPAGTNTVIGYYYYVEGNEGYVIVHNSEGYHFIYRLKGYTGSCEVVYNFCRSFPGIVNHPRHFFSEGRIEMKSICRYLPDGTKELYKELFLVNTQVDNLRIVVEDAIATNSFTTPFFLNFDACCGDPCRIIKSGVPTPMGKIKIDPITPTAAEKLTQNTMLFKMFQFRVVDENAWGQRSEHGLISEQFYNNPAGCSRDAGNLPHCVWLTMKKPCPEIVRRYIEVRSCELKNPIGGNDGNLLSEWKEAMHIDLYDQTNTALKWYERSYDTNNKDFEVVNGGRSIRVKFCNNRECKPIALADIRNQNPAPINSATVCSVGKGLVYGSNENNLGPFAKADIDSISLSLTPTEACQQKYARIKVYAVVHNWKHDHNNPIHMRNGRTTFGGFGNKLFLNGNIEFEDKVDAPETGLSSNGGYGQTFPDGISGFRAILAGTNFSAESVQYMYSPTDLEKIGVISETIDLLKTRVQSVGHNHWFIQEFDFGLVPAGTYRFRILGHNDTENLDRTSTYYIDTTTIGGYNQNWSITQNNQKEIFIDTSNGNDFVSFGPEAPLAVIADLTDPNSHHLRSRVLRGYLYESRDNNIPIELAEVHSNKNDDQVNSAYTDHNGFYFVMNLHGNLYVGYDLFVGNSYKVQLRGSRKCQYGYLLGETGTKASDGTTLFPPMYADSKAPGYGKDLCSRYVISGKITECSTGVGIEGMAVVLAQTAPAYTNSKGEFRVIAHYCAARLTDTVIFSLTGSCYILDCNCNAISVIVPTHQPTCVNCAESNTNIGSFSLKTVATKGFPHGSRIQVGMVGEDWLGRMTDIQTSEKLFVDFPSEQEQLNPTYPKLMVNLPDRFSADLCKRFKTITFWYSKNTNYEDWLEWAADDVQFVDSAGNKNNINPTKIKIWYRSLNGYNLLRGMNTNTNWSFYDTAGNSRLGDTVEFIENVDGKYFPANTVGNVQYDQQGAYFLVDYEDSLKDVKAGVRFKIKRPYACEINKTFYEFSFPINFCRDCAPRDEDGVIIKSFHLNGYSAYMLPRQIPVIRDVETIVSTTGGSSVSVLKNIILTPPANKLLNWNQGTTYTVEEAKTTEEKKITIYPFSFEHHSPSDTWGDHCHNGGRVSYINPYEGKKCDRTQFMLTGGLNQANDGAVNYLHWFSLADEFVIDEAGWGGITALLGRSDGQLLLIAEFAVYSFRSQDDRAIVDKDGFVRLPVSAVFGAPERNPSASFGCQMDEVNTIRRIDSLVFFLDANKQAAVLHDFSQAVDVSPGIQSWLVPAIKKVSASGGSLYWHSCFDLKTKRIFLTKFDSGLLPNGLPRTRILQRHYVNNEIELRIDLNETMSFNYETRQWKGEHFTPEYFGQMHGDPKDTQFFSFKDALPYAHHNAVNPSPVYLNYFGLQCFPVIGVVTNQGGTVEKSFTATQVFCRELLFILERLETSLGQKSQVYEGGWEYGAGTSMAAYFCDTDNPDSCRTVIDPLLDGDTLYGFWLKGLYIPNPDYKGEFFMLTAILSTYFDRIYDRNNDNPRSNSSYGSQDYRGYGNNDYRNGDG